MKIIEFTAENFKRLSVIELKFDAKGGLIQLCGPNESGKTSALDSVWALFGGEDALPDRPIRKGQSQARMRAKIGPTEDGGYLIMERKVTEKGNYLTITNGAGAKLSSPQKISNAMWKLKSFDPLEFMRMKEKEQFDALRSLVGIDFDTFDRKRLAIYENRTLINRDLARAKANAESIDVPDDLPTRKNIQALTEKLAGVDKSNEAIRAVIRDAETAERAVELANEQEKRALEAFEEAGRLYEAVKTTRVRLDGVRIEANERAAALPGLMNPESIRAELEEATAIEEVYRRQQRKIDALAEMNGYQRQSDEATAKIEAIVAEKNAALTAAKMPIDGLAFADGAVSYEGLPLSQASGALQLRVSAAIAAALNPTLHVLLCRDGSLLDSKSLKALADFADERDFQIFLERMSETGDVGIVMEDGHVKGQEALVEAQEKGASEDRAAGSNASAAPPDEARIAKAKTFLAGHIEKLNATESAFDADKLDGEAKVKLQHFPEMVRQEWNPAYLAHVKALTGKRT
jgi:PAS domain-containing protein